MQRTDIRLATATGTLGMLQLRGGCTAELAQNILFKGNITLAEGSMLALSVYDATVAPGKTITGTATAYVRTTAGGALCQTVATASANAPVFYPVGQSSYNPAWLSQNSAGTTDVFAVSIGDSTFAQFSPAAVNTTNPNRGRGRDMRGVGQPIINSNAGAARTWYIDEITPGGSNLILKLQNILTTGPTPPKVDVSHYHIPADAPAGALPTWDANPADQIGVQPVATAGQVSAYAAARANITDFSPFTLTTPTVLPVELTAFGAKRIVAAVTCTWETASEKNSDYFLVERSTDGFSYAALGKVMSAGSTTERQHYHFTDQQPLARQLYYRLRQVDKDGTESFSPVVVVAGASEDSTALQASVVPNPGTGVFELLTSGSTVLEANIYNALGRHVWRLLPEPEQARRLRFDLTTYPAGVYIVHVRTAEGTTTLKVVKTN